MSPATASGRPGVLLSLKPRFAEAILSGSKDVELRRQPVGVEAGDLVVLYSSSPIKSAIGWVRVREVIRSQVDALWRTHGARTSLQPDEFFAYYEGAEVAHALILSDPHRLDTPLPLEELRTEHGMHPPQSWRYLPDSLHPSRWTSGTHGGSAGPESEPERIAQPTARLDAANAAANLRTDPQAFVQPSSPASPF